MPLINGIKMACEPCIRGHRSTKCTHAEERLMVPVRKPGRPLSACPHPSSRSCSCTVVTAAIPRKQKCSCGPSSQPQDTPKEATNPPSNKVASPTGPKPGSFRVSKNSRSSSGRNQSVDLSALERMDSNQLNIISSSEGISTRSSSTTDRSHTPTISTTSATVAQEDPVEPAIKAEVQGSTETGVSTQPAVVPGPSSQSNGSSASCCGGNAVIKSASPRAETNQGTEATKSCCSQKPEVASNGLQSSPFSPMHGNHVNQVLVPPYQMPMMIPPTMYPYFPAPTIYTYPPQFGSYMQPLQPEQWRQFMAAMYFPPAPHTPPYPTPAAAMIQPSGAALTSAGTSHECRCGDSCQCVGCAAHPYNEATQNYVRSACNSMFQETPNGAVAFNEVASLRDEALSQQISSGANQTLPGTSTPVHGDRTAPASPTPPTPSDAASNMSEDQQQLSANDFFFVTYPIDDGCAGDMATCNCGDDCDCIGCVIHGSADTTDSNA